MRILIILSLLLLANLVRADLPAFPLEFPRDHGTHFENTPYPTPPYLLEWWYFSGEGETFAGEKVTFYASAFKINVFGTVDTWYLMGITDPQDNSYSFVTPTGVDPSLSTLSATDLSVHYGDKVAIDRFQMGHGPFNQEFITATFKGTATDGQAQKFSLIFAPTRDPLLHGGNGVIDMADGGNSYYYSQTRMITAGIIKKGNKTYVLNPLKSVTWFDHQWGDFTPATQHGWEWFGLRLDNGSDIMVFMDKDNTETITSGNVTFRTQDGNIQYLTLDPSFIPIRSRPWISPMTGATFWLNYLLDFPELGLTLDITPIIDDQDAGGYEGAAMATGSYLGQPITASGAIEVLPAP